jgi:hypothetical protein
MHVIFFTMVCSIHFVSHSVVNALVVSDQELLDDGTSVNCKYFGITSTLGSKSRSFAK